MQVLALIVFTLLISAVIVELQSNILSDPPSPEEPTSQTRLAEDTKGPLDSFQAPDLPAVSALTETLERPLFIAGRRVVKAPVQTPVVRPLLPRPRNLRHL